MRCYTIQFASDFIIDPGLGDIDFPAELRQIFDLGLFIPFVVDVLNSSLLEQQRSQKNKI